MSTTTPDPDQYAAAVDAMLDAAGIAPSMEEKDALLAMYVMFRPRIDALYQIPEARYEVPALVFEADPKLGQWGA